LNFWTKSIGQVPQLLRLQPKTASVVLLRDVGVPNWSSTSCDLGVFVYQPVEQIATSQVNLGWRCRWW
jgi:hypothetical protein